LRVNLHLHRNAYSLNHRLQALSVLVLRLTKT
jgi:hypothetical protein